MILAGAPVGDVPFESRRRHRCLHSDRSTATSPASPKGNKRKRISRATNACDPIGSHAFVARLIRFWLLPLYEAGDVAIERSECKHRCRRRDTNPYSPKHTPARPPSSPSKCLRYRPSCPPDASSWPRASRSNHKELFTTLLANCCDSLLALRKRWRHHLR